MSRFIAFKVTRALIARVLFALHSLMSVWVLYAESRRLTYWTFAISPVLLFVEGAVTILLRHGDEYKWFCPSVFIFLCGSVPPIWLLELKTTWRALNNATRGGTVSASQAVDSKGISNIMFELTQLPEHMWLQVVEQSLLVILILGRWLLPKGRITRDQLSQLLLAYLAISADIVELFNLFQERKVRMDTKLSVMVLAFWSVSLVQFPFVITTVKSQKARYCFSPTHENPKDSSIVSPASQMTASMVGSSVSVASNTALKNGDRRNKTLKEKACDVRVWGILSTILLQDLPFWILRVYLVFWEEVMSYTMFFFICKNSLIMWIQVYRLVIICGERERTAVEKSRKPHDEHKRIKAKHLLYPRYNSSFSPGEPRRLSLDDQRKSVEREFKNDNPSTKSANNWPCHRNGTAKEVVDEDRRQSFNVTGSVNARDVAMRTNNRRKPLSLGKYHPSKIKRPNFLAKRVEPATTENETTAQQPQIALASPDAISDEV